MNGKPTTFARFARLRQRLVRRVARLNRRAQKRAGLTLLEMGLAVATASAMAFMITSTVASALRMQMEADRLTVAAALAQTKLAQLLTNTTISSGDSKGSFGSDAGIFAGYDWSVHIREEKIDLAKVMESGKLEGVPLDDQMPAGIQNESGAPEKAGQTVATQTGGLVDVVRLIVRIYYPRGDGIKGEYRVETFRRSLKES